MIVKIIGMVAAFSISVILGRTIGPEGLGVINIVNKIIAISVILALLGTNTVILKEIAIAYERKDWQHVAKTIFTGIKINIPVALVLSFILIWVTPWLTENFFDDNKLRIPLIISSSVIVFQIFSKILVSGINGFRKVWQSNLFNETLSFIIVFLGLMTLFVVNQEITILKVTILYAISRIFVALITGIYWKKLFKYRGKKVSNVSKMLKTSLPLLIVSSTSMIAANADVVMLGWLSNSREVGFYSVAAQLGLLSNFFLAVSISSLSPKIASLYADKKMQALQKMIQQVTKGLFFLGIITIITYFFTGKFILSIWGQEFVPSYWILIIITVGQFFNISTGSTGVILMMTGHEKIISKITVISLVLNLIMNYVLIPKYGAAGAATATAGTVIVENVIKVIVLKNKTNISTIPFFREN